MKALIIILALVAASFLAVLAYGLARDRSLAPPSEESGCGGAPPRGNASEAMEGWCPPDALSSLGGLQRRFGPGVEVKPPEREISLTGSGQEKSRQVPASGEDHRIANLQLVSGDLAVVKKGDAPDAPAVCLCRAGAILAAEDLTGCSERWRVKQTGSEGCLPEADRNSLPFGKEGGTLTFTSARPATVRVR